MNKTALLLCICVVVCAALLAPGAHAQQDPIIVEIYVGLGTGSLPDQIAVQDALAEEWNATHEDIKIVFQPYGELDALVTLVAEGVPPAIVGPIGVRLLYLIDNYVPGIDKALTDIAPLIARDADELALDDFDAHSIDIYAVGERVVALPLAVYPSFVLVNETRFAEGGVDLPPTVHGAWTWDDLRARAIRLTRDANGVYADQTGFDPLTIERYGYVPFWSNFRESVIVFSPPDAGVQINADGTLIATYNQDAIRDAVAFYHDGIFSDYFMPDVDAQRAIGEGFVNPFVSGRVAMGISHTWLFPLMQDVMDDHVFTDQWNVYPIPAAPNGVTTAPVHADTFVMMDGFAHQDAAWEVYKWLMSPDISQRLCDIYGCMPARISARGNWDATWREAFPFLHFDVVYGALDYLDAPHHERDFTRDQDVWETLEKYWRALRSDPDFDVYGELDAVNAEIQAIFEE